MANVVEEHWLEADGLRLYVRHFAAKNPRATIAIVHGFGEHGGRYVHVAEALEARGFDVWIVDLRGHGRSEGPRAYVESMDEFVRDVRAYLAFVRERADKVPLFLLGHSLGGCISTLYTLRERPALAGLVLSSPALKLGADFSPAKIAAGRLLGKFVPKLPIEKLSSSSVSRDPAVVRAYERDPLVYHGWVRTGFGLAFIHATEEIERRMEEVEVPLLVLQGSEDKLVNPNGGKDLYRRARSSDKHLEVYEGLYHEVFNEPEKERVLADLARWLDAHCAQPAASSTARPRT
ncbi:MAG: alpha/beta hydrolase [Polyangiaceae bacterium]|nr:alpha/beta hydrolase [Polyangiaceae bacterium]